VNPDLDLRKKEKEKIDKVITFGYLVKTCWKGLKSLMHFFSVLKGDKDIRMVYNGTKSGLNLVTWIPWFAIPSSATLERMVIPGSVQADNDYEDMFLNFILHEELQAYTGVDVSALYRDEEEEDDRICYVTWDWPAMGLTGSPYTCVQAACRGKRVTLRDRHDKKNVFHWQEAVVNLPGTWSYDPTLPRLYKRRFDGKMAGDLVIYIDDVRVVTNSFEESWRASSRVAKTCAWLGLQDAARKRREPSIEPGAWAGTVMWTTEVDVKNGHPGEVEKDQGEVRLDMASGPRRMRRRYRSRVPCRPHTPQTARVDPRLLGVRGPNLSQHGTLFKGDPFDTGFVASESRG
jgi:hypothetical protein